MRARAAIVGLLLVAGACTSGDGSRPAAGLPTPTTEPPEPRVIAFSDYLQRRLSFYADEVIALDPETLERIGTPLRLGDAVTTPVVDPDERLVALGGYNFGKVIFVDPVSLEVRGKVEVAPRPSYEEVYAVAWPEPGSLLGYAQESAAHHLLPGRAFLVDPESGELVKSVALHGSVMRAAATRRGAAFLVASVRKVGRARVVLMGAQGDVRTVELRKIAAGFVDPGTPGESLLREPAIVPVRNKLFVVGASEPVAMIGLRSGKVRYHSIPGLMKDRLPGTTDPATGTAGALEVRRREALAVGGSRVLVWGQETRVVRGGSHLYAFARVPQIVDLARRRVRRSFDGLSDVKLAGRTLVGRTASGVLEARALDGSVLFRRPGRTRSWIVLGNRLLETAVNGRAVVELDPRTGRVVADLGEVGPWITSMLPWPPLDSGKESLAL